MDFLWFQFARRHLRKRYEQHRKQIVGQYCGKLSEEIVEYAADYDGYRQRLVFDELNYFVHFSVFLRNAKLQSFC